MLINGGYTAPPKRSMILDTFIIGIHMFILGLSPIFMVLEGQGIYLSVYNPPIYQSIQWLSPKTLGTGGGSFSIFSSTRLTFNTTKFLVDAWGSTNSTLPTLEVGIHQRTSFFGHRKPLGTKGAYDVLQLLRWLASIVILLSWWTASNVATRWSKEFRTISLPVVGTTVALSRLTIYTLESFDGFLQ